MTLVTIVIPTHNRQHYAAAAAAKVVEAMPSAQVVVSDTSGDDRLRAMLPVGGVDYVRPGRPMDVVSHFEWALEHARGRYVMFLGDDDCVGPGLAEVAAWADRNGVDAVLSYGATFLANYFWPGVRSRYYAGGYESRLFVHPFTGEARPIDTQRALREVLRDLGRGLGDMPRIYHGLVSAELIGRVRDRFGSLFGGVSPDIYSATLLSETARNAWRVDYPFCLPGGSPASTAGTGAAGTDLTSLKENPHTAAFDDLRWDPLLPAFYAPYMVWAYSLKKAADRLERSELQPNLARVYALSLIRNREQAGAIDEAVAAARALGLRAGRAAIAREVGREAVFQARRYGARLMSPRAGGSAKRFGGLADIGAAYDRLERHIAETGVALRLPEPSLTTAGGR